MSHILISRRPSLGILAVMGGVFLASCQTGADEVLSLGDTAPSEEASTSPGKKAVRDPFVVAVSGQMADASGQIPSQNETDPPRLKRKPVPMAAAYSDIAEPPPEVLALQQQASAGNLQPQATAAGPVDLGELTMQPTAVAATNNSLFSAGQKGSVQTTVEPTSVAEVTPTGAAPRGSLVPNEMPTLGVNAVRKSLFSPSPEQQMLMQQQALQEQAPSTTSDGSLPLTESAAASTEEPVLKKLSDPRPKRKMLALREPAGTVPDQVQLTPEQLQAMGAVDEANPAEPLPAEERVAEAELEGQKKRWLPSLSDLLKGGKKQEQAAQTP